MLITMMTTITTTKTTTRIISQAENSVGPGSSCSSTVLRSSLGIAHNITAAVTICHHSCHDADDHYHVVDDDGQINIMMIMMNIVHHNPDDVDDDNHDYHDVDTFTFIFNMF